MTKKDRLKDILNLINKYEIDTQEELTEKLNELGYNVSQATVSRDINELSLIKVSGLKKKNKYSAVIAKKDGIPDSVYAIMRHITVSVERANNLIVIKTLTGNANSLAGSLDQIGLPNVLGTIAGDDTVLIISNNDTNAETIVKVIKGIINA